MLRRSANAVAICSLVLGLVLMMGCQPKHKNTQASSSVPPKKVGVYDSRCIAIAFLNSPAYKKHIQPIHDQKHQAYQVAIANNDQPAIEQLEVWGRSKQALLHQQAFGTESVDAILVYVQDQIPLICQQTGVTHLISKWDQQALAQVDQTDQVDVTMLLVDAFKPDARQRKAAVDIRAYQPIKLSQAQPSED